MMAMRVRTFSTILLWPTRAAAVMSFGTITRTHIRNQDGQGISLQRYACVRQLGASKRSAGRQLELPSLLIWVCALQLHCHGAQLQIQQLQQCNCNALVAIIPRSCRSLGFARTFQSEGVDNGCCSPPVKFLAADTKSCIAKALASV